MAATVIETGTDVNFGALTEQMARHAVDDLGVKIEYGTHVKRVHRSPSGSWLVETQNREVIDSTRRMFCSSVRAVVHSRS